MKKFAAFLCLLTATVFVEIGSKFIKLGQRIYGRRQN